MSEGQEVTIVKCNPDSSFSLELDELKKIFLRDDVKDIPVALVSVAGPYRGGKSFILNFMLRYLKASQSARDDGSWLGKDDEDLVGFGWRGGSVRNTMGMLLWSEPLFCTDADGKRVAVFLMDTQGTFDNSSSVRDCSTIFALACLMSSLQIYNIFTNIREDDLQQLELFTEYGKLAKSEDGKPFQVLEFLIRDWPYPYEYEYGVEGGKLFIEDKLQVNDEQPREAQELRRHLANSFDKISCFLMPHPGDKIGKKDFKGHLNQLSQQFKDSLKEFVTSLFSPDKLSVKKLHGEPLVASDMLVYFETYMNAFNSGAIPTPSTIWEATSSASVSLVTKKASAAYDDRMRHDCALSMSEGSLRNVHRVAVEHALSMYRNTRKIASDTVKQAAMEKLNAELNERFQTYISLNSAKTVEAKTKAREAFDKYLKAKSRDPLCMDPEALEDLLKQAIEQALKTFDGMRRSSDDDLERKQLQASLETMLPAIRTTNDQNNRMGVNTLRNWYWSQMYNRVIGGSGVAVHHLRNYHQKYVQEAVDKFRNDYRHTSATNRDTYVKLLEEKITIAYQTLYESNERLLEHERALQERERALQEQIRRQLEREEREWREERARLERLQREKEEEDRKARENKSSCAIL